MEKTNSIQQRTSKLEKAFYLVSLLIVFTATSIEHVLSQDDTTDPKLKALVEEIIAECDGTRVLEMKELKNLEKEEFLDNQALVLTPSFIDNVAETVRVFSRNDGDNTASPIPTNDPNKDLTQPIFREEEDATHPEELKRQVEKLKNTLKGFFPGIFPPKSRQQTRKMERTNVKAAKKKAKQNSN